MKLWLLRPMAGAREWEPWYDKCFGFVIRAKTEEEARQMAADAAGDENRIGGSNPWLNPAKATCEVLSENGIPEVIIRDYHAA